MDISYLGSIISLEIGEDILVKRASLEKTKLFGSLLEDFDDYFSLDYIPVLSNRAVVGPMTRIWHDGLMKYLLDYLTFHSHVRWVEPRSVKMKSGEFTVPLLSIESSGQIWFEMASICYLLKVRNPFSLLSPGGTPIRRRVSTKGTHQYYIPLGDARNILTEKDQEKTLDDAIMKTLDCWEGVYFGETQ